MELEGLWGEMREGEAARMRLGGGFIVETGVFSLSSSSRWSLDSVRLEIWS